ncbi:hypothetical protein [Thermobrachium celere]|nr:hypothetical protein [Thermobrachium celere]
MKKYMLTVLFIILMLGTSFKLDKKDQIKKNTAPIVFSSCYRSVFW